MILRNCDLPDGKQCENISRHKYAVFHTDGSKKGCLSEFLCKRNLDVSDSMK